MARLPITATKAERLAAHRNKMAAKKARRGQPIAAFTPVANKRVDAAIAHATMMRHMAGDSPAAAERGARRDVAGTLPARRRDWFKAVEGPICANLSRNHPDAGLTPRQHATRKAGASA